MNKCESNLRQKAQDLRSFFSNCGDLAVFAFPSLLSLFFLFFPPLAPGAPTPPTRLWHEMCKKVNKKDFFDKL
jgi:hypothetical protein